MMGDLIISFFITGHIALALKIGVFEVVAKIFLQYVHERVWLKIPFGLSKKSMDYQI